MSDKLRAIGLMSGTSMDGVDVALIETDGEAVVSQGPSGFLPYDEADRSLLRAALKDAVDMSDRHARPGTLAEAELMVSKRHIEAVSAFIEAQKIDRQSIDVIGFHGQTVLHRPDRRLTVQIGDGAMLAQALNLPIAYDFRAEDVAVGGQGAPLVPAYHRALATASGLKTATVVINIGGVANLTFLREGADPLACDTGPGNALLDDLMLVRTGVAMDQNGVAAALGRVNGAVLETLLRHPYFELPMPKSLDRNDFSSAAVTELSTEDAAATLTAFTAQSIAAACRQLPSVPELAIICGGGAANPTLMRELSHRLPCPVVTASERGWSSEAMEAQAFAFLAVRRFKHLPITFPTTTGVPAPMTGGIIAQP